jgi:hypothetical protein
MRVFDHKTLESVGARFGVTRERVRMLEKAAIKYFKKNPHLCPDYQELTVKIKKHLNGYSYFISRGFQQVEGAGGCSLSFIYQRIKRVSKDLVINS